MPEGTVGRLRRTGRQVERHLGARASWLGVLALTAVFVLPGPARATDLPDCTVLVGQRGSMQAGLLAPTTTIGDEDVLESKGFFPGAITAQFVMADPDGEIYGGGGTVDAFDGGHIYAVTDWAPGAALTRGGLWTLDVWDVAAPECRSRATFTLVSGSVGPEPTPQPTEPEPTPQPTEPEPTPQLTMPPTDMAALAHPPTVRSTDWGALGLLAVAAAIATLVGWAKVTNRAWYERATRRFDRW